jgi:hypothetical protein
MTSSGAFWTVLDKVRTLREAHEVLTKVMPSPDAKPVVWREFYLRSAEVYRRVAEVDRFHHHEALYWANREQEKADQIAAELRSDA